jgi:hypothetical protein
MPLRIAFDMDGVLADMDGELARHAERLFGAAASAQASESREADDGGGEDATNRAGVSLPATDRLRLTSAQHRRLWQHIEAIDNFWETLAELEPGAVRRLHTLAASRHWEVLFLTRRPRTSGDTSQLQTQRWLEAKGFRLPSVYVVQGSRGRIAAALDLDVVVDDRPENCLDVVVDSQARAILVWRDEASRLPASARRLGVGVVSSVEQCLEILIAADASGAPEGLMTRILRLLGLKDTANA